MPLTVLVTDGDQRSALAIVRALGRRGITVIVGADARSSLASASKYCARHVTYPSPYREYEAFRQFVAAFVSSEHVDVLMPVTDVTTRAISQSQHELARCCSLAVPAFDAFELVTNKRTLVDYAAACGVPAPRTHVVADRAALPDVLDRVVYPVVVKPAYSRIRTISGWIAGAAHYADCRAALLQLYDEHDYLARHPSLIQERIVGSGVGLFAVFDHGRLVTDFSHRRVREKPPAGGVSVLSESVPVDPRLREYAIRMLSPIGWHGVVMMEYKHDRRTGEFFLIEVNGRFWGSLQLAIDAGVDFPFLTCQLAAGREPDPVSPYRVGVRHRWLLGDLDHLLMRMFRSAGALDLADDALSRWRTLVEFLEIPEYRVRAETLSRGDWRPFAHELQQYVRGLLASRSKPALPVAAPADAASHLVVER